MDKSNEERQNELSESLLSESVSESVNSSVNSRNPYSSFSLWWNGGKYSPHNGRNNSELVDIHSGRHDQELTDVLSEPFTRKDKVGRLTELLKQEVSHETSATKNYILFRKKVYLSRICFALASYTIVWQTQVILRVKQQSVIPLEQSELQTGL